MQRRKTRNKVKHEQLVKTTGKTILQTVQMEMVSFKRYPCQKECEAGVNNVDHTECYKHEFIQILKR